MEVRSVRLLFPVHHSQGQGIYPGFPTAGFSKGTNELAHKRWSDDLATKLLCVFALDRFGDYISDQVHLSFLLSLKSFRKVY